MIKVFEAFSGYGSQSMALKRAGIDFEIVGISEIDKYAITGYEAVHGKTKNFGDISKINTSQLPEIDLFTYSFPCQDVSISGRQSGVKDGTRSGLLWYCEDIIRVKKPKILLMENVKNLVGKKHKADFDKWCFLLESYGYKNFWQVLNAKEHGVPQNRERVFMISILGSGEFKFPEKEELKIFLIDMLEPEVDEKYYLKPEQYSNMLKNLENKRISNAVRVGGRGSVDRHSWDLVALNTNPSGRGMNGKVHVGNVAPTLTTNKGEGLKIAEIQHVANTNSKHEQNARVYGIDGISPTIAARDFKEPKKVLIRDVGIIQRPRGFNKGGVKKETCPSITSSSWQENNHLLDGLRVRKLTPLECFRIQDVKDEDFYKIRQALINTHYNGKDRASSQLYKLAGNSIPVNVLTKIFKNIDWSLVDN